MVCDKTVIMVKEKKDFHFSFLPEYCGFSHILSPAETGSLVNPDCFLWCFLMLSFFSIGWCVHTNCCAQPETMESVSFALSVWIRRDVFNQTDNTDSSRILDDFVKSTNSSSSLSCWSSLSGLADKLYKFISLRLPIFPPRSFLKSMQIFSTPQDISNKFFSDLSKCLSSPFNTSKRLARAAMKWPHCAGHQGFPTSPSPGVLWTVNFRCRQPKAQGHEPLAVLKHSVASHVWNWLTCLSSPYLCSIHVRLLCGDRAKQRPTCVRAMRRPFCHFTAHL